LKSSARATDAEHRIKNVIRPAMRESPRRVIP
jgi:hypothetical protein